MYILGVGGVVRSLSLNVYTWGWWCCEILKPACPMEIGPGVLHVGSCKVCVGGLHGIGGDLARHV